MYSALGDTTSLVPGYPIRTSSDPRSVDNSPRHIAASHVLHRLPVPRHPPCALTHLQHKTKSFVQNFEIAHQHQTQNLLLDARNHYPQIKHHTPPPKQGNNTASRSPGNSGLVVSKPNSVSDDLRQPHPHGVSRGPARLLCTQPAPLQRRAPSRPHPRPVRRRFSWCSLERR
jgi:hypothetical protein